jgi:starch-binding outer membrane protein, SusD/RagB family
MKKILCILLITLTTLSCSDFLEEENLGSISNEDFYKTKVGYETLITAAYSSLRTTYGASVLLGDDKDPNKDVPDVSSCPWLLLAGTDLYQKTRQNDHLSLYEYVSLYSSDTYVLEFYTNCYNAIQTINTGLYYVDMPSMDEQLRAQYKAELRFLRAFYHFILVEQFGGITINDEITLTPRLNLPRNTLTECYDFIISEIEECLPDLTLNTKARVNQNTANHYLAKIYLTRAWDIGNNTDFTKAKEYAQSVINALGPISLTYNQLWSPSNENNNEFLLAVQYDDQSIGGNYNRGNTQQALFGQYMGGVETNQKLMLTQLIPAWNLHKWYAVNDARYNETFMLTVYENYFDYYDHDTTTLKVRAYYPRFWGHDFTKSDRDAWKADHDTIAAFVCYPFLENDEEAYRASFQRDFYTPVIKKFDSPKTRAYGSGNTNCSVRDIVLARLAEDYFMYAEACIGLNDYVSAANYVQDVLDRPGNAKSGSLTNSIASATTQQEALELYLIESGKEFAGEYNGRWPELRRTKMLKFMVEKYNYDIRKQGITLDFDKYKLRPIPQKAINLNEGIDEDDQNPGY